MFIDKTYITPNIATIPCDIRIAFLSFLVAFII